MSIWSQWALVVGSKMSIHRKTMAINHSWIQPKAQFLMQVFLPELLPWWVEMCFCTYSDYRSCNTEICWGLSIASIHLDVNYFSADVFISTDLIQSSNALSIGFCWLTARTKRDKGFFLSRRIEPGQSEQSHLKSNYLNVPGNLCALSTRIFHVHQGFITVWNVLWQFPLPLPYTWILYKFESWLLCRWQQNNTSSMWGLCKARWVRWEQPSPSIPDMQIPSDPNFWSGSKNEASNNGKFH